MKDGDWVYCEFDLGQLKQEGDRLEFSNGTIRMAFDVRDHCFPISMDIKNISEEYSAWMNKLHEIPMNGLNFPDIHQWMVNHWHETCMNRDIKDRKYYRGRYEEVRKFCEEIIDKCRNFRDQVVNGVPLGRR